MGEQPTTNGTSVTNGQPVAGIDLSRMRDRGRLEFESAFRSGGELAEPPAAEASPPAEAPKAAPAPAATEPPKLVAKKPAAPVDDFDEDDDDDAADEFDDSPTDSGEHDADTKRRVAAVQRQEARAREQLSRERAEFEREKAKHADLLEQATKKTARTKHEAIEMLEELGLDDDEWGILAKRAHARSKDGKSDPKWREQADREAASKRTFDDVKSLRSEIDDLKSKLAQRDTETQTQKQLDRYFDAAVKLANDDSPLFSRHLSKNPDAAQRALAAIAQEGLDKKGSLPKQTTLIKVYERRRRAELEELGVDVDALIGKKTKEQALAAAKEHAANTTSTNTAATPANGAGSTDRRSLRQSFVTSKDAD